MSGSDSSFLDAVRAINDHVINSDTTRNAQNALDNFVNNSVPWDNDCVPYYWAQLSNSAGYNVTNWNTCSG
jgi:hypothetical protein